jgi:phosphoribosylformylglycinamidine synthase subunit PurS
MTAHIWVMPKRTVLDPQGQTIQHALSGLGYEQVSDVRQGKFFVLNLDGWTRDEAQKQLERISKEVLANPVIEEYRFEIVDFPTTRTRLAIKERCRLLCCWLPPLCCFSQLAARNPRASPIRNCVLYKRPSTRNCRPVPPNSRF